MAKYIENIRRIYTNLLPWNRVGVIADLKPQVKRPDMVEVFIDRGERNLETHGVYREFSRLVISKKRLEELNVYTNDLIYVGYVWGIIKLASLSETPSDKGRFIDWDAFHESARKRRNGDGQFLNVTLR